MRQPASMEVLQSWPTLCPLAVGLALADTLRERQALTTVFFGEGAIAEGDFHEAMNLASLWHAPVLFCCENNLYGMGTALHRAEAVTDLTRKAATYGIPAGHGRRHGRPCGAKLLRKMRPAWCVAIRTPTSLS